MEEYTTKPALRTHMLAVETVMRHFARLHNQDEEHWGLAGLLHDFDYERFETVPDHPVKGSQILADLGVGSEIRMAILGHANLPEYPRETVMAKTLFAIDELTGLVMAATYVRPSKSILDLEVTSVKKKMKDKSFAAGVNREDIYLGATELNIPVEELIQEVIIALRGNAQALGLQGSLS
jgi:predicted hydrolase (HD superfamily)